MRNSPACRTCYEDGLRRVWREEFRFAAGLAAPMPMQMVPPRHRLLYAPALTEEDAARIRASQSFSE
jgi:hypothetical protein